MTEPKTWEEAAQLAATYVHATDRPYYLNLDGVDADLDGDAEGFEPYDFAQIGAYALGRARPEHQTISATLNDIVDTVIAKQHDYGHGNILRHGITGIVVRMCDKVERIRNLEKRLAAQQPKERTLCNTHQWDGSVADCGCYERAEIAKNEPLADGWNDLVGYSIIGIMLLNGTFELPLAADLVKDDPKRVPFEFAKLKRVETESGQLYVWSDRQDAWVYGGRVPQ